MNPDAAIYLGSIAAIGLVLKSTVLFNVEVRGKIAKCFVVLCIFFIIQSAAEFLAYFTYLKSVSIGEFFVHVNIVMLWFVFPSLFLLALALTKSKFLGIAQVSLYLISSLVLLAYLNGYIITGLNSLGWTVITTPGEYYWIAMGYLGICCLATVTHLATHFIRNKDAEVRYNSKINLIAIAPLVLVAFAVLSLKLAGFNSSSVISLPLATLAFLFVMLLHTNGNLFWFSTKFKTVLAIIFMDKNASVEAIINEIETVRIQEALKLSNGQQKIAAEILNIPPSTLNKRISKYKIDANKFKLGPAVKAV